METRLNRLEVLNSEQAPGKTISESTAHIIDELYNLIFKFDQLAFIDPQILSNFYPFNVLDDNVWHYGKYILFK